MFSGRNSANYERLEGGHGPGRPGVGRNFAWKKFAIAAVALITLVYLFGPRETPTLLGGSKPPCAFLSPSTCPLSGAVFSFQLLLMTTTTLSQPLMAILITPPLLNTSDRVPTKTAHLPLNLTRPPATANPQPLNLPHLPRMTQTYRKPSTALRLTGQTFPSCNTR